MDNQDIADQKELLHTYRQTLAILLRQQASFGFAYTPPAIIKGIHEARSSIRRIKDILNKWGVSISDHPNDVEPTILQNESPNLGKTSHDGKTINVGMGSTIIGVGNENFAGNISVGNINQGDTHIHIEDGYLPDELQDLSCILKIMDSVNEETLILNNKINIHSDEIKAISVGVTVIPKSDLTIRTKLVFSEMINSLMHYTLVMRSINTNYRSCLSYVKKSLFSLFKVDAVNSHIESSNINKFKDVINNTEAVLRNLLDMIGQTLLLFEDLRVQLTQVTGSAESVVTCSNELDRFRRLINETLQVIWQTNGIIDGVMRKNPTGS